MTLKLHTAPVIEPVSLAEAKLHLRIDSGTFSDDVDSVKTIVPGTYNAGTVTGSAVQVAGYSALAILTAGVCSGSLSVKLQHSDDTSTWFDVTVGAFITITGGNDNATYELAYTGTKRYLRAVATVTGGACAFGVSVILGGAETAEDNLIQQIITAAREYCEVYQRRAYLTQTWELWLDAFPAKDYLELPRPPLASVTSIEYYDTANTKATMSASDYYVDVENTPGGVQLAYGKSWPSASLRPRNGVCITYVAGETAAASVPQKVKQAMLLLIGHWYENREAAQPFDYSKAGMPMGVDALLWQDRNF